MSGSGKWVWAQPTKPAPPKMAPAPARPTKAAPKVFPGFDGLPAAPGFAAEEKHGSMSWKGGTLSLIQAEDSLPFVDLPGKLVELVKHCWTAASPSQQAPRSAIQIGSGNRPAQFQGQMDKLKGSWKPEDILEAQRMKERNAPYAKQVQPIKPTIASVTNAHPHLGTVVPTDWKTMEQIERVNGYTFRGDRRDPSAIEADGGFHPPISRTDKYYVDTAIYPMFANYMKRRFQIDISKSQFERVYQKEAAYPQDRMVLHNFFIWRSMLENEAYHIGKMLANECLKGYISTTRAAVVAKGFARSNGWVYLTLVAGGFLVPDQGKHVWTAIFGEQEVAYPASLPWSNIFGFRQVDKNEKFTGPVYMRKGFAKLNPTAYRESFDLLSGKAQ